VKKWFPKHWLPTLIALVITVICFAALVQIFKETNCIANWLFNFLNDWALVLSASVTLLLATAAFWAIRESRVGAVTIGAAPAFVAVVG